MNEFLNNKVFTDLNQSQKEAVKTLEGPLLVLSGAGTGKTTVLIARLANLLYSNVIKPWNILAVTFTNKAAKEMKNRLEALIGPSANSVWMGTFHSIAARILRENAELVKLTSNFTIITPDDQNRLLKQIMVNLNIDIKKFTPKAMTNLINSWKDKGHRPDDVDITNYDYFANGKAVSIYRTYQSRLITLNSADFGDLLLYNLIVFSEHPDILKQYQSKILYFLVDEYQDTNTIQYLWLRLLVENTKNICCVGDDDQSIYGWRGARVGNILRFEKDYPSAKVIKLEENYRSTASILEAANSVISNNKERLGKNLKTSSEQGEKIDLISVWDGVEEARKISIEIENLFSKGLRHDQMAVLVRAGHQTRHFEERFIDIGIPYKVIGAKFYERLEIRDALAYLRVVQQPKDDLALERIINVPKRGLGSSTINLIHSYARKNELSFFSAIQQLLMTDEFRPNVKKSLQSLVDQFIEWKNVSTKISHTDLALKVFEESGYLAYWQNDKSIDGEGRLENLKELINAMSSFENLSGFLEHISLVMDGDNEAEAGEVSLMTLHAAKGLEFDVVFLPGWEEGLFPSQRSIDELGMAGLEEERRLAYVGITRARKRLFITFAANRLIHGLWQGSIPSRFISELPKQNLREDIEGNLGSDALSYNQIEFEDSLHSRSYGPGYFRAKQNKISTTDLYKPIKNQNGTLNLNQNLKNGQRVFHQKFGMGFIISSDGDKLNINFDKAGEKRVISSFVKVIEQ
ncbi:UvrD-helicase domain-containing protein [Alphaproteobacteria bacterium]|nr:UvrD-helicase domain-containing protein [Alphaproteobacteria bacterium]